MKFILSDDEMDLFFERGRLKYLDCVTSDDNEFLVKEFNCSPTSIELVKSNIKIVIQSGKIDKYTIEVSFNLLNESGNIVGRYTNIENNSENSIDDSLVIF
jgi:hypothetical protein